MESSSAKQAITKCHCKIDRRRIFNLKHECRWRIRKRKETAREVPSMIWDISPAVEEFANVDEKSIEDANTHSKNTDALMTLLLKGFRRYQTKLLIKKYKTAQNLEKNVEVSP